MISPPVKQDQIHKRLHYNFNTRTNDHQSKAQKQIASRDNKGSLSFIFKNCFQYLQVGTQQGPSPFLWDPSSSCFLSHTWVSSLSRTGVWAPTTEQGMTESSLRASLSREDREAESHICMFYGWPHRRGRGSCFCESLGKKNSSWGRMRIKRWGWGHLGSPCFWEPAAYVISYFPLKSLCFPLDMVLDIFNLGTQKAERKAS